jgi:hypothetical protein
MNLVNGYFEHRNVDQGSKITENERAALNMGIVIGIDISRALKGVDNMPTEQARDLLAGFEENTKLCKDMKCVMDRITRLEEIIRTRVKHENQMEILR